MSPRSRADEPLASIRSPRAGCCLKFKRAPLGAKARPYERTWVSVREVAYDWGLAEDLRLLPCTYDILKCEE